MSTFSAAFNRCMSASISSSRPNQTPIKPAFLVGIHFCLTDRATRVKGNKICGGWKMNSRTRDLEQKHPNRLTAASVMHGSFSWQYNAMVRGVQFSKRTRPTYLVTPFQVEWSENTKIPRVWVWNVSEEHPWSGWKFLSVCTYMLNFMVLLQLFWRYSDLTVEWIDYAIAGQDDFAGVACSRYGVIATTVNFAGQRHWRRLKISRWTSVVNMHRSKSVIRYNFYVRPLNCYSSFVGQSDVWTYGRAAMLYHDITP